MNTKTLSNGAVYDLDKKKIVSGAMLTSDTARDMVRAREEKRIRLYNEGAKRAVLDPQLIRDFGDDAHIVERGMTLQTIASTPDAGKAAVMAAQHLDKAQGLVADKVDADSQAPDLVQSALLGLIGAVMDKVHGGDNNNYRKHNEADIIEAGGEEAGGG